MSRRLFLLLALLLICQPLGAEPESDGVGDALDGLSGKKALALVEELADDAMKGRKTAFEGGALVENWMLGKFSEFGLHPADAGGTYLEPFTYGAANVVAPIACKVGARTLTYGKDYYDLIYSGAGKVSGEAVFCGYGICRPDLGWDDYADLDVKGKIVIAIRGVPKTRAGELQAERYIGAKSATAADKGARAFVLVEAAQARSGTIQDRFHRANLPALWISGAVADEIFAGRKTTLAALKTQYDEGKRPKAFASGVQLEIEVHSNYVPQAKGHNALGSIRGRDPDLTEEIILVGAHMDHLGVDPTGRVFNGADDNASGTAVLVHLADVLSANRLRPKRTIIFCGFGAEEQGLVGSRALAARYPWRGNVVCVLNMDMVGQGKAAVRISGGGAYPAMQARLESYLPETLRKETAFGRRTGASGDHWPFHERGVPAFFIATQGKHPNYHTPEDDAASVKAECLEAAARTVGTLLVRLANHPEPLHDPKGLASYLLREGPRFANAYVRDGRLTTGHRHDGAWAGIPDGVTSGESGISALVVTVDVTQEKMAAPLAFLESLASAEGSPYLLARNAADLHRAWRTGRIALLPRALCPWLGAADAEEVSKLAAVGYRWISPWSEVDPKSTPPAGLAALASSLREARVLVDLGRLGPAARAVVRTVLKDWPATRDAYPVKSGPDTPGRAVPDAHTLLLIEPLQGRFFNDAQPQDGQPECGAAVSWLRSLTADPLAAALSDWIGKQPAGWEEPRGAERKSVREALGARLMAWLARTER